MLQGFYRFLLDTSVSRYAESDRNSVKRNRGDPCRFKFDKQIRILKKHALLGTYLFNPIWTQYGPCHVNLGPDNLTAYFWSNASLSWGVPLPLWSMADLTPKGRILAIKTTNNSLFSTGLHRRGSLTRILFLNYLEAQKNISKTTTYIFSKSILSTLTTIYRTGYFLELMF